MYNKHNCSGCIYFLSNTDSCNHESNIINPNRNKNEWVWRKLNASHKNKQKKRCPYKIIGNFT